MATFFKTIRKTVKHWYVPAIIGALFVVLGFYLFTVPLETYATLTALFSISFLVTGILETWFSIQNREELEGWGWHLISGLFSLAIGILLVTKPEISALTLPMFIGFSLLFRAFHLPCHCNSHQDYQSHCRTQHRKRSSEILIFHFSTLLNILLQMSRS